MSMYVVESHIFTHRSKASWLSS